MVVMAWSSDVAGRDGRGKDPRHAEPQKTLRHILHQHQRIHRIGVLDAGHHLIRGDADQSQQQGNEQIEARREKRAELRRLFVLCRGHPLNVALAGGIGQEAEECPGQRLFDPDGSQTEKSLRQLRRDLLHAPCAADNESHTADQRQYDDAEEKRVRVDHGFQSSAGQSYYQHHADDQRQPCVHSREGLEHDAGDGELGRQSGHIRTKVHQRGEAPGCRDCISCPEIRAPCFLQAG